MSDYMAGHDMASSHDPKEMAEAGRVCSFKSCKTILSVYNPSERCSLHPLSAVLATGVKALKPKGKSGRK